MEAPPISEEELYEELQWLDTLSFTRPKKNINRDFSDGLLVAQAMKHYYPQWVQLHNFQSTNSSAGKWINWKILNQKVFKKLGFQIHKNDIEDIIKIQPGAIEKVLHLIFTKISKTKPPSQISRSPNQNRNQFKNQVKYLSDQLQDQDKIILQLRDTIEILENKMKKMEQLNKLKDTKIQSLIRKIQDRI